MLARIRIG